MGSDTICKNKQNADTIVLVKLSKVTHKAISTDNEGYAKTYRTIVSIIVKYKKVSLDKSYHTIKLSNYYDYSVDVDSGITDQKKEEAIRLASANALSDIFSKIAINTFKK